MFKLVGPRFCVGYSHLVAFSAQADMTRSFCPLGVAVGRAGSSSSGLVQEFGSETTVIRTRAFGSILPPPTWCRSLRSSCRRLLCRVCRRTAGSEFDHVGLRCGRRWRQLLRSTRPARLRCFSIRPFQFATSVNVGICPVCGKRRR
jgi:hypothetical protein